MKLIQLPVDVIHVISLYLECKDISRLIRSCKFLCFLTNHSNYYSVSISQKEFLRQLDKDSIITMSNSSSSLLEADEIMYHKTKRNYFRLESETLEILSYPQSNPIRVYPDARIFTDLCSIRSIYSARSIHRSHVRELVILFYQNVLKEIDRVAEILPPPSNLDFDGEYSDKDISKLKKLKKELIRYQYLQGTYVKLTESPVFITTNSRDLMPDEDIIAIPIRIALNAVFNILSRPPHFIVKILLKDIEVSKLEDFNITFEVKILDLLKI